MSVRYLMDRYRPAHEKASVAGYTSHSAMATCQHGTANRYRFLAERLGATVAEPKAWSKLLDSPS